MNKRHLSHEDVEELVRRIIASIQASGWEPEIIVGISRGGLLPAVMLSHYFECPMQPLVWCTRDSEQQESNCWLAEDAAAGKHTLIVDDIIDTGKTITQIMDDWDLSVVQNIDWGNTVKVAGLQLRDSSEYSPAYQGELITNNEWQVYPWEEIKNVSE